MNRMLLIVLIVVFGCSHRLSPAKATVEIEEDQRSFEERHCKNDQWTENGKLCRMIAKNVINGKDARLEDSSGMRDPTVQVYAHTYQASAGYYKCEGMCGFMGTGVVIGAGLILTAEHVVENSEYTVITSTLIDKDGKESGRSREISVKVVKTGFPDYAILQVVHTQEVALLPPAVSVAYMWPQISGLPIWQWGKTSGIQHGTVLPRESNSCSQLKSRLPLSMKIQHGDSGAPIFYGRTLVGIVTQMNELVCQSSVQSMLDDIGYTATAPK